MNGARPIMVRGEPIAKGRVPAICAPLVGLTAEAVLGEVVQALEKSPDALEWRVDYFGAVANAAVVVDVTRQIKARAPETPLIFTRRSEREGGANTSLDEDRAAALYEAVCDAGCVDLVDWELANDPATSARVRAAAHARAVGVIGSYHDFRKTPDRQSIAAKFAQASREGADVAKVAVMPRDAGDVLTLLAATWEAHQALSIPLISMAMGPLGALSRIGGFAFGSALTFGVVAARSAPGQLAIDDLRAAVDLLQRA